MSMLVKYESEKSERDRLRSTLSFEKVCAYDRTLRRLLSQNITSVRGLRPRLGSALQKGNVDCDQGWWIADPSGVRRLGNFMSHELIYVNGDYRVLEVVRPRSMFMIPRFQSAVGVLALPPAPSVSAPAPGNELLICVLEELEARLQDELNHSRHIKSRDSRKRPHQQWALGHLRLSKLTSSRNLVVKDGGGRLLHVNGIRDVGPTGLHLLCEERLPLGAMVCMTLKPTRANSSGPRSLNLVGRVIRLGLHGFTIAFVEPTLDVPAFLELAGM